METTVTTAVVDLGGQPLETPYIWRFRVLAGRAPAEFRVSRPFGTGHDNTAAVVLGDLDGDGDLDLAVGFAGGARVYLNAGDGTFPVSRPVGRGDAWILALVPGDVNGDGLLDLAAGHYDDDQNMIYLNRLSFHLPVLYKD